jgi:hypothetical protein
MTAVVLRRLSHYTPKTRRDRVCIHCTAISLLCQHSTKLRKEWKRRVHDVCYRGGPKDDLERTNKRGSELWTTRRKRLPRITSQRVLSLLNTLAITHLETDIKVYDSQLSVLPNCPSSVRSSSDQTCHFGWRVPCLQTSLKTPWCHALRSLWSGHVECTTLRFCRSWRTVGGPLEELFYCFSLSPPWEGSLPDCVV